MKIFKKRFVFPAALLSAVIIGAGAVYAITPLDFAPKAGKWVKQECTQKLLNRRRGEANGQKATICYNYIKNSAQDGRIASLTQQSTALGQQLQAQQATINSLQNKTAQPLTIFTNAVLQSGDSSSTIDTKGNSMMFLNASWPDNSGQGCYQSYSSTDQITWTAQDSICPIQLDTGNKPESKVMYLHAQYYKFEANAQIGDANLSGFMY